MPVQTAASNQEVLTSWRPGLWRLSLPRADRAVIAGVTDRSADVETLRQQLTCARGMVLMEQVHRASLVAIESPQPPAQPIPGCDALTTRLAGVAVLVRTADCLPLFVWDPIQQVVGLAHAGWRGLVARLPLRLIGFLRHVYHSDPRDLVVGIGPAIRACCYEVGIEVAQRFGPFLRQTGGRRTCDLIGCATTQLLAAGVRPSRVVDCGCCTACDAARWHSVRRDGADAGRLVSFILLPIRP